MKAWTSVTIAPSLLLSWSMFQYTKSHSSMNRSKISVKRSSHLCWRSRRWMSYLRITRAGAPWNQPPWPYYSQSHMNQIGISWPRLEDRRWQGSTEASGRSIQCPLLFRLCQLRIRFSPATTRWVTRPTMAKLQNMSSWELTIMGCPIIQVLISLLSSISRSDSPKILSK